MLKISLTNGAYFALDSHFHAPRNKIISTAKGHIKPTIGKKENVTNNLTTTRINNPNHSHSTQRIYKKTFTHQTLISTEFSPFHS